MDLLSFLGNILILSHISFNLRISRFHEDNFYQIWIDKFNKMFKSKNSPSAPADTANSFSGDGESCKVSRTPPLEPIMPSLESLMRLEFDPKSYILASSPFQKITI